MSATLAAPRAAVRSPITALDGASRSAPARLGGVRRIGEILPLVMAQYAETQTGLADPSRQPTVAAENTREIVLAVQLAPTEAPQIAFCLT